MSLYMVYFLVLLFGFIFWVMNAGIRALNEMMNYDPLDPEKRRTTD